MQRRSSFDESRVTKTAIDFDRSTRAHALLKFDRVQVFLEASRIFFSFSFFLFHLIERPPKVARSSLLAGSSRSCGACKARFLCLARKYVCTSAEFSFYCPRNTPFTRATRTRREVKVLTRVNIEISINFYLPSRRIQPFLILRQIIQEATFNELGNFIDKPWIK